ncbi:MAG TPA: ribokinase [Anaerolineae bacterium]|nr:ribokinase [Anaerolineae bacterium]HMR67284.1 ribokinase [Anaerolineae bacterium]
MARPKVCVVGSSNLDLVSYVDRLPALGETRHGTGFQMGFGGKGANQAVMAAKLGAEVTMVTKLGQDIFGENTLKNFQAWDIDTRHVFSTAEAFSGVATITVDSAGRNTIVVVGGANSLLTPAEVEAARPAIEAAAVVLCQLEIPIESTLAALRIARQAGVTTLFNPAPAPTDLPAELYTLSDIFCPNENETELLTGQPVNSTEAVVDAARVLLERGAGQVILTLGERGSVLVNAGETVHLPAVPVQAVDTTGAGDAFVGSLAYFLAAGQPLTKAAARANRIAALSVQGLGTQTSFPQAADLPPEVLA